MYKYIYGTFCIQRRLYKWMIRICCLFSYFLGINWNVLQKTLSLSNDSKFFSLQPQLQRAVSGHKAKKFAQPKSKFQAKNSPHHSDCSFGSGKAECTNAMFSWGIVPGKIDARLAIHASMLHVPSRDLKAFTKSRIWSSIWSPADVTLEDI